ncbi:hypothetical protein [Pseudomonas sp. PS01297]|uniref:hypothetical protein n=1 Tax=Pseudomonas sp. PS01297 TaxID=2991433 RepID=UPI00249B3582|nr:hypothetical protein [Pseudomonas sp. PS01297]
MDTKICEICAGSGGPVEVECPDCEGTGFDPIEDKPFAQCHGCYGEEIIEVEVCPNCCGTGRVNVDDY